MVLLLDHFPPGVRHGARSVSSRFVERFLARAIGVFMAIRIKSRGGESVEQMMRRFKKLCEKEGLTKDIKRKEFYEKPSERRRRRQRKTSNRFAIGVGAGAGPARAPKSPRPPRA